MNRREMLKKTGIATLVGASGMIAVACATSTEETVAPAAEDSSAVKAPEVVEELSERDKLIVNRIRMSYADPENPTDHELKHTPDISFGDVDDNGFVVIDVILGKNGIIHPGLAEHWIDYLTFYVNDKKISHLENENGPVRGAAKVMYQLNEGDIVKVEAGCNLHGIWESEETYSTAV
jgi:desulfoferrodoxin-like iron-binding protein